MEMCGSRCKRLYLSIRFYPRNNEASINRHWFGNAYGRRKEVCIVNKSFRQIFILKKNLFSKIIKFIFAITNENQ
jgi:hypothetical protein